MLSRLTIDTSVRPTPSLSSAHALRSGARLRSSSSASTTSTLSIVSPGASSSTNGSSVNLPLKDDADAAPSSSASARRSPAAPHNNPTPAPEARTRSDYVLAMHDYSPSQNNATCLEFLVGQFIHVLNRDASGWWDGELDGRRGWFPSNYVTDVVVEEDQPQSVEDTINQNRRPTHKPAHSTASAISWASAPVNGSRAHRSRTPTTVASANTATSTADPTAAAGGSTHSSESDYYCHPLMIPLAHGLSLLQSTVRSNRISHFQPSTACIVSCIRSILSATECLTRDAPPLQLFPPLALERKHLLSILATLVSQAKKASEFSVTSEEGEDDESRQQLHLAEIDKMLRLGGELFAAVRRFLAMASQCGLEIPERRYNNANNNDDAGDIQSTSTNVSTLHDDDDEQDDSDAESPTRIWKPNGIHRTPSNSRKSSGVYMTPGSNLKARSMVNLRTPRISSSSDRDPVPQLPTNQFQSNAKYAAPTQIRAVASASASTSAAGFYHHNKGISIGSSNSSGGGGGASSEVESEASEGGSATSHTHSLTTTPSTSPPPFPRGPTSAPRILDALRITHDHYLSTIAAFIGHAHSHSRSSHASSTGHMYDLVREIVEMVCRLLTIVDAVMRHPDVLALGVATGGSGSGGGKVEKLRAAKEGLYKVASGLAESVRVLTMGEQRQYEGREDMIMSEDEEKRAMLRSATGALKAGADCVFAVKTCLSRQVWERPFVVAMTEIQGQGQGQQQQGQQSPDTTVTRGEMEATPTSRLRRSMSLTGVGGAGRDTTNKVDEDEDVTIQAQSRHQAPTRPPPPEPSSLYFEPGPRGSSLGATTMAIDMLRESSSNSDQSMVTSSSSGRASSTSASEDERDPMTVPTTPEECTPLTPSAPDSDLMSMMSRGTTDDGATTWEGSMRGHGGGAGSGHYQHHLHHGQNVPPQQRALESKIFHGQLPAIPLEPGFIRDPEEWLASHDYAMEDVAYNGEGHMVGATLQVLVTKMTPHDVVVDPAFQAVFFLTFRLFSSPLELVDTIITRYGIAAPRGLTIEDEQVWQRCKGVPVRLRVSNFIRMWLEQHWRHESDEVAIEHLVHFVRGQHGLAEMFPGPAQRILDLLELRVKAGDKATASPKAERSRAGTGVSVGGGGLGGLGGLAGGGDPGMAINPPSHVVPSSEIPRPVMTKTLLSALRSKSFASISVTDFDALELARQLTIMECKLYCAIQPEEVLQTGQEGVKSPVNVKAMSSLSTAITGWVAESILNEPDIKKRTVLIKFFIKVADRCTSLKNYSTSRSMLAALDSSTISRLHQTWAGLPQKSRVQLDSLRRLADHSRNYHEYRTVLRNTAPPAVPFLGLYLTDVTFCREGNPSYRASPMNPDKKLINFNKYHKLARIVQDMQRFQVPYQLKAIPEVQEFLAAAFLNSSGHGDLQDLYRRSLLVEPKQPADAPPTSDVGGKLFTWGSKSQVSHAFTNATNTTAAAASPNS